MGWLFSSPRRRLLVPEVVQTSAMDCGPAALTCLLEGFGIHASYGRLREACQTDVDGTSIDTIEAAAVQLGLDAEQTMLPPDHLLRPEARALPALVIVRMPGGLTHFVVVWRRHGNWLQLMDPATGRRWVSCEQFLKDLYLHSMPVPAEMWREWAGSPEFRGALASRLGELGIVRRRGNSLFQVALEDASWRSIAALDAATRMTCSLVNTGAIRRGRQAGRLIEQLAHEAVGESAGSGSLIPDSYWSVRPAPPGEDGQEQVLLRGAVLVCVRGRRQAVKEGGESASASPEPLSPELEAALREPPARPWRHLLGLLKADGLLTPMSLIVAMAVAAAGVVLQALLLRGLFDLGHELRVPWQRLAAMTGLVTFLTVLLLLEIPIASTLLRLGRKLEVRLRLAFFEKIPRLGDRYFQSRPVSDMAERAHSIYRIRQLPELGGQLLRGGFELALTALGIAWLEPSSAPIAALAALMALVIPLAAQGPLAERDLRVRTHLGALGRFYLDALLGLVPIRVHAAQKAVQREHDGLLMEWARASLGLQRTIVMMEGAQFAVGFGLAAWLVLSHVESGRSVGTVLLLVYWALSMPAVGQRIAWVALQYPTLRNTTLRLLEPLGAADDAVDFRLPISDCRLEVASQETGVHIDLEEVSVVAAGHTILQEVNLAIRGGEHVAVVGPSAAGKSSLVGLLLGWHRPATGQIRVDGEPLDAARLQQLRRHTVWVDPTVQLWNRSLLDNLRYGASHDGLGDVGLIIETAELRSVLEKLPDGLQSPLGEAGGLLSGGEGQRVRLGRGMYGRRPRLVILDEPFRGLDRRQRCELLTRARRLWGEATLICITHDMSDTQSFPRVLVVADGRIVEDDDPRRLVERDGSRYAQLLTAEKRVREEIWSDGTWRRLRLERGQLIEEGSTCGQA